MRRVCVKASTKHTAGRACDRAGVVDEQRENAIDGAVLSAASGSCAAFVDRAYARNRFLSFCRFFFALLGEKEPAK